MQEVDNRSHRLFRWLLIGFGVQVAGRLVDLQWHLTHDEFEGGWQQLQAHWLIWLATLFVLWVAAAALRAVHESRERLGYFTVLLANLAYGGVAIAHFFQHLNNLEVDWAHLLLAVFSIAATLGMVWVIVARVRPRRTEAVA